MARILLLCFLFIFSGYGYIAAGEANSGRPKAILLLEHESASPWTELLREGLAKGGRDFNFQVETIVAPPATDQSEVFRKAASSADLVLVATDNFHEILRDNAANFRRVKFGSIDAGIRAANIMSVTFADEQAAFLAGVAAAMLTVSPNVPGINAEAMTGWLSGADTPAIRSLFNGYSEGVKLAKPGARIAQALAGSFTEPAAAAEKAARLAKDGADVIVLAAGTGNEAAARALPNAWFVVLDKPDNSPRMMGAIVKKADNAVYEIMKSAAGANFAGKEIITYNLANKGVDFIFAPQFLKQPVPRDIERRVAELRHELATGSIKLPSLRARTLCDCLD